MERCRVSNRVSHWEDNSTKAEPSCFGPVVNTKSVFSSRCSVADHELLSSAQMLSKFRWAAEIDPQRTLRLCGGVNSVRLHALIVVRGHLPHFICLGHSI
jgi:hypothetical protein